MRAEYAEHLNTVLLDQPEEECCEARGWVSVDVPEDMARDLLADWCADEDGAMPARPAGPAKRRVAGRRRPDEARGRAAVAAVRAGGRRRVLGVRRDRRRGAPFPENSGAKGDLMNSMVRCTHCRGTYDLGHVEVTARYTDCSVWKAPCCGRVVDDRGQTGWTSLKDYEYVSAEEEGAAVRMMLELGMDPREVAQMTMNARRRRDKAAPRA
jgi:hypothetical protein